MRLQHLSSMLATAAFEITEVEVEVEATGYYASLAVPASAGTGFSADGFPRRSAWPGVACRQGRRGHRGSIGRSRTRTVLVS
jgi:hypothetical protein